MLSVEECLAKARRNKLFISQHLAQIINSCPDWITVVAFYSALHFVDAHLLRHHGMQRENHEEREREVAIHMLEIYPKYKRLFDLGFRSRYQRIEENPTIDEAESAIQYDLPEVENYVMERMS